MTLVATEGSGWGSGRGRLGAVAAAWPAVGHASLPPGPSAAPGSTWVNSVCTWVRMGLHPGSYGSPGETCSKQ